MSGYNLPDGCSANDPDAPWNQDYEEKNMSDDETRREDARIENAIEKALRNGVMGYCAICGDETFSRESEEVAEYYPPRWICKPCQRMMDDPGD